MKNDLFSIQKVFNALCYAIEGLFFALKNERAFRQELLIFVPLSILAIFLANSMIDYLLLVAPFFIVIALELVNTSIEQLANLISTEHKSEIKVIKDCAAAAVLIMMVLAVIIWLVKVSSFL